MNIMTEEQRGRPTGPTELKLMEALQRLVSGVPKEARLRKLVLTGKLRITISGVAQEAGLSRTLIAHEKCKYPRARAAVLKAANPPGRSRTAVEVINRLREENTEFREAVRIRDSINAAFLRQFHAMEAMSDKEARRSTRAAAREGCLGNRDAPGADTRSCDDEVVVPIRPSPRAQKN